MNTRRVGALLNPKTAQVTLHLTVLINCLLLRLKLRARLD